MFGLFCCFFIDSIKFNPMYSKREKGLFLSILLMNEEEKTVDTLVQLQFNELGVVRIYKHDCHLNTIDTTIEERFPFFYSCELAE